MPKVNLKEKSVLVYDYGLCLELAVRLARDFGKVYYYCAWEDAFPKSDKALIGEGFEGVERVLNFWNYVDKVDLICFFDTFSGDIVDYLRKKGYLVWGAGKSEILENNRYKTVQLLEALNLPTPKTQLIVGVENLINYLKENKGKWIKINTFRGDLECVDEETEILTNEGWKFFKDLDKDKDRVLSMDLKTRKAKFVKIKHYFQSFYEGEMYRIKGRSIDLLVTPKHKFFVKSNYTLKKWKYLPIEKFKHCFSFRLPLSFEFQSNKTKKFHVVKNVFKSKKKQDKKIDIRLWVKFLGWFLSEGNLYEFKQHKYRIMIGQSKGAHLEKWKEIKEILNQLGYNYQIEGEDGFSIYDKSLYLELLKTCYQRGTCAFCGKEKCGHLKKIPSYLFDLPKELKTIFLDAFSKGDGCLEGKYKRYYTTSKFLADGIQILILETGKSSTVSWRKRNDNWHICYSISEKKTRNCLLKKKNISKEFYKGFVYDITVEPYHSILLRRNGKVCWTGNSFYHHDYDTTQAQVLGELLINTGAKAKKLEFIVQDEIPGVEPGYDGWIIDGNYPLVAMYGYELKGGGYIGKIVLDKNLPPALKKINTAFIPVFKKLGGRTFVSTEVRVPETKEGYLIDYCLRLPMPVPGAIHTEIWKNFSEIIWFGAQGKVILPRPAALYGVGISIESDWAQDHWTEISFKEEDRRWIKFRRAAKIDGKYYALPGFKSVCSVIGLGNKIDEAIEKVKKVLENLKIKEMSFNLSTLEEIKEKIIPLGRKYGVSF